MRGHLIRAAVLAAALACPAAAAAGVATTTTRESVSSTGAQGNHASGAVVHTLGPASGGAMISENGRVIAFSSGATNLSRRPDTNGVSDVFVRDLVAGTTRRVSVSSGGAQANGTSSVAGISKGGRFVLFSSRASNLAGGDHNRGSDAFVRDLGRDRTSMVSVAAGRHMPGLNFATSISGNGRFVTFTNLNRKTHIETVFLHDRRRAKTYAIGHDDFCPTALVSDSGRYVAFDCGEHDPSLAGAVLLDRRTGKQTFLDGNRPGLVGTNFTIATDMSDDGRYVVFTWGGLNEDGTDVFNDVYEYDRVAKTTTLVTTQPAYTAKPWSASVSQDGRYVTFTSDSPHVVAGDTNGAVDVFRRDMQLHTTVRIDLSAAGTQSSVGGYGGSISGNGSLALFQSTDPALVAGDTNHVRDVFLRGPLG